MIYRILRPSDLWLDLLVLHYIRLGEVMVGFTAIMVHHRVWKEHKIDSKVFAEMKHERRVGMLGLVLIIVGACTTDSKCFLVGVIYLLSARTTTHSL